MTGRPRPVRAGSQQTTFHVPVTLQPVLASAGSQCPAGECRSAVTELVSYSAAQSQNVRVTDQVFEVPGSSHPEAVTRPGTVTPRQSQPPRTGLVLSLFPGIDLLGRGFEAEGWSVVRGPDLLFGGDIRDFWVPAGLFTGVIGGSPCQDFSSLRRSPPTGYGEEMIAEFGRVVTAAAPAWWLLENVPGVPDIIIDGYTHQRFDLRGTECGLKQRRLRHFQFGSRFDLTLVLEREPRQQATEPVCTASEGKQQQRRGWSQFCTAMGLPADFDLPSFTQAAKYQAVGNGVPLPMARLVARAIRDHLRPIEHAQTCACGCGRRVFGRAIAAGAACRKRLERRRRGH